MSATTPDGGQVPTEGTGQVPTPTTPAPVAEPVTPKTYNEEYVTKLRGEAAGYRTELKALKDADEARKTAELSETERLKKEASDAATARDAAIDKARTALGKAAVIAAATKLGVKPELAQRLVDVAYDDEGEPTGVEEALAKLVKAHPELVSGGTGAGDGGSPTNPARGTGTTATFDPKNPPRLGLPGLFKGPQG